MKRSVPLAILSLSLIWPGLAPANPGHEVTVAELSAQIAKAPDLPELYFQRAWNYREMQRPAEARADWEKTLSLNAGFLPASRELARSDAQEGRMEEGIARLRQAMASAPASQDFHRPGCHSVLAELLLKQGKNDEALKEAQTGLDRSPDLLLDLCLLRSEAQRRLGKLDDRVGGLAAAMTRLRSFVVKSKWYDAMIDAGRGEEILPEVEQEVANTRYQASWLIRRARIRQFKGEQAGAASDLASALEEINHRLRPENPDLSLVCDRGLIHALQGDHAAAAADLKLAREQGADFWMTLPLAALQPAKVSPTGETAPPAPAAAPSVSGKNDN
mgnify:CR=1 FL=1